MPAMKEIGDEDDWQEYPWREETGGKSRRDREDGWTFLHLRFVFGERCGRMLRCELRSDGVISHAEGGNSLCCIACFVHEVMHAIPV